jgi:hypothetical protein
MEDRELSRDLRYFVGVFSLDVVVGRTEI